MKLTLTNDMSGKSFASNPAETAARCLKGVAEIIRDQKNDINMAWGETRGYSVEGGVNDGKSGRKLVCKYKITQQ